MHYRWLMILGLGFGWGAPVLAEDDAVVFASRCAACHGADGRGRTPQGRKIRVRDLAESRLTEAEVERQIREGSRGKTGVSIMPAVGKDMTDAEIQAAVRVVLGFRAPGPAAK